jgi:ABC-type oligopeptide transport system substrate-binding subunit
MKSKKAFCLLSFLLLSALIACGDSPKQIKETGEKTAIRCYSGNGLLPL